MIDKNVTYKSYLIGFILSLLLTFSSYIVVMTGVFPSVYKYFLLLTLVIVQLFVQVVYFLHINAEAKPRWNLISFIFTIIIVFIVVFGSMWVMYSLNSNMMH